MNTDKEKTPIKVVAAVCIDNNIDGLNAKLNQTLNSLSNGKVVPTDIVAAYNPALSNAAKKKLSLVKLDKQHSHLAKTKLASLAAVYQKYREDQEQVHIFLVEPGVVYPEHYVSELLMAAPELDKNIRAEIKKQHEARKLPGEPPEMVGIVVGVCGIMMTCDRKKVYEEELQWLQDGKDINVVKFQKNAAGRIDRTSVVDLLSIVGGIYIDMNSFDIGKLLDNLEELYTALEQSESTEFDKERLSADVILANQLESQKTHRIQLCNLALNQFYMGKSGALGAYADKDPSSDCTNTLIALEAIGQLNICKPVSS